MISKHSFLSPLLRRVDIDHLQAYYRTPYFAYPAFLPAFRELTKSNSFPDNNILV